VISLLEVRDQPTYFVTIFKTRYNSVAEAKEKAPEAMAAHIARSRRLHKEGRLIMAGALSSSLGGPVTTMGVFYTKEDAEEYAKGDPFVINGMVSEWWIQEWANILRE
jgi:uncharacterized protein YciI